MPRYIKRNTLLKKSYPSKRKVAFKVKRKYSSKKKRASSKKKYSSKKYIKGHGSYKLVAERAVKGLKGAYNGYKHGFGVNYTSNGVAKTKIYKGLTGAALGGAYGAITGHGTYKMNSILAAPDQIPSFDSNGRACTRIKHREYVTDINTSTAAFTDLSYPINPTSALFPFLSNIAANFEEYRFEGLVFEFKSTSGTATGSTNQSQGYVLLATEYNAALPPYISKTQADNAEFSVSGAPYNNLFHPIECARGQTPVGELYVSPTNGVVPSGQDPRLYNLGLFQVCTGQSQAAYNCGQLWASYDVCLYKPKLGNVQGTDIVSFHAQSTTGIGTSHYFGTTQSFTSGSTFSCSLTNAVITLPATIPLGQYLLIYDVYGTSTAAVTTPTITFDNVNVLPVTLFYANSSAESTYPATTSTNIVVNYAFQVVEPGGTITFSGGGFPTSPTAMDLFIIQLNQGLN